MFFVTYEDYEPITGQWSESREEYHTLKLLNTRLKELDSMPIVVRNIKVYQLVEIKKNRRKENGPKISQN